MAGERGEVGLVHAQALAFPAKPGPDLRDMVTCVVLW
jgi:hypothetical protein